MRYVDVSAAVHGRAGLGRYAAHLAQALIAAQPGRYALFYNGAANSTLPQALAADGQGRPVPHRRVGLGYKPWRLAVWLGQAGLGPYAPIPFNRLAPGATLFHGTEHLLLPLRGVPTVLTVHDLIFKLFPAYHKRLNYWYLNRAVPLFCRRASAIIAVSQATKQDIVRHYAINPAKIHVVHEAASKHFRPPAPGEIERLRRAHELPQRFLIHLGTIEPRKNLGLLLDAMPHLRRRFEGLCLILVGAKGWLVQELFDRMEQPELAESVRHLGWVADEELPALIAAADLAVQPSLYEGFGLPLLEHMACGQVVAASNRGSHPEIGGQAVAYFEPDDLEQLIALVSRLLTDQDEYQERRRLGLERASRFSWQRAAAETIAVYDNLD